MPLKRVQQFLCVGVIFFFLNGCMSTRSSLVDVKATIEPANSDIAYKAIRGVLLDKGFDIKMSDKDLRIVTTEYKKFSSVSGWPPFDFYLQIKGAVRDRPNGRAEVTLWPRVKEQNRLNANAFTGHPLLYYSSEEIGSSMSSRAEAMQEGQSIFQGVVLAIAEALGLPGGEFNPNLQQIEVLGM
ncbi:MAG: hypothetical protein HY348_03885 [Nitrospira defluvii]|nr:hypothetical protein [Nitrospira defluvii]